MSKDRQAINLLQAQNMILEMVATGQPLVNVLKKITYVIEEYIPNSLCLILLFNEEENTLGNGIGPSLADEYIKAINGTKIGQNVGSCVKAASHKETVIVENIETDPIWRDVRSLALSFGLRACWSKPTLSSSEQLLGTFSLYYRKSYKPSDYERQLLDTFSHLASLAIEREKTVEKLSRSEEQYRLIAENVSDLVGLTDENGVFTYLSPSHEKCLGYSFEDLLGKSFFDYIHPDDMFKVKQAFNRLIQTNRTQKVTCRLRHHDGHWVDMEGTGSSIIKDGGQVNQYVYVARDISEHRKAERKKYQLAYYDSLTQLPNHSLFQEHFSEALESASKKKQSLAILYIDVNRFKYVNDTLGLQYGDELLKLIAKRLTAYYERIYRISGDEFVITLYDINPIEVEHISERLLDIFKDAFYLGHHQLHMNVSIGISLYPDHGQTVEKLMKNANIAIHNCKQNKKSGYQLFTFEMSQKMNKRMDLEHNLYTALENENFVVYYQPQIDIRTGEWISSEALVRWKSPELGLVSPADFIPIAEETGLIVPIGKWVLDEACKQQLEWMKKGYPPKTISVNLSVQQFYQDDLVNIITEVLNETGLDPQYLVLEITESVVMEKNDIAIDKLEKIRSMGIKIALDDFGTGYSSLNYLKSLPIDILKIDKSFLHDMNNDSKSKVILKTIILLASQLGITVLAEGIETEAQLNFLKKHHCHMVQGFFFSAPVPSSQLITEIEDVELLV
jgi:diguanylate cyclase (GGDEF)-like protein/PAS domain S-box-containing protein